MIELLEYLVFGLTMLIGIFYILFYAFKKDKERGKLTIKLFIISIVITVPTTFFEIVVLSYGKFPNILKALYQAFVLGFIEEFIKRYVLINLTYKRHRHGPYPGLGYALVVASGFATGENILYFLDYESYDLPLLRVTLASCGHLTFAIIMGLLLTIAKHAKREFTKRYYFVMSLVVSLILHSIFDYLIFLNNYILLPVYLIVILIIYIIYLKKYRLYTTYLVD